MRLHRFYIKEKIERGKDLRITDRELLHQWLKVFRLSASDRIIIFDGSGYEFEGYFKILSKNEAIVFIDKATKNSSALVRHLEIFQAIIKKDNF